MLQFEEQKMRILGYESDLKNLGDSLGLEILKSEIVKLEEQSGADDFWNDLENSQKVLQKISQNRNKIVNYDNLKAQFDDTLTLIELADEEGDLSLLPEVTRNIDSLSKEIESQTLATLLKGEFDSKNAILTFHAGAGGTEAQDWAQMLLRMYTRWAERHGFKTKTLDFLDGEEAGI
ncbi:MAG: PCRF domain-containing protein, partial [Oscillospiraceae bacterium]